MNLALGKTGEQLAVKFLDIKGFKVIETNYISPLGEIDIIAQNNSTLYFIEVKTRSSNNYGTPFDAVNYKKQQKLSRIATYYMMLNREYTEYKFGVIGIIYNSGTKQYKVKFIDNAFDRVD